MKLLYMGIENASKKMDDAALELVFAPLPDRHLL